MTDDLLYFNGIDGESGEPLLPPMPIETVAEMAQGKPVDEEQLAELKHRQRMLQGPEADFGVMAGIDSDDLSQAGWGVIFAAADQASIPAIKEALGPLLNLRRGQAGDRFYDETHPQKGLKFLYQPGESKNAWLARNGSSPGVVDPEKVPYYLLIVGDPQAIPYRFQHQLDVAHAVGRIHFETLEEYSNYARSVVAAEVGNGTPLALQRNAAFFGVRNRGDRATGLSTEHLVTPLAETFAQDYPDWEVNTWLEKEATKSQLCELLGGDKTPAFLFTASHGMGFRRLDHPQLIPHQGALICSDWRGRGPVKEETYFSADDLGGDANLLGMIAFHFACYGAGTPQYDNFAVKKESAGLQTLERIQIAPHPIIARLPQRLLGHPRGGALAMVGHVDRAWGYSFMWQGAGQQLATFESSLTRMFDGSRLGYALEDFGDKYADISTELSSRIEDLKFNVAVPPAELAGLWTANNDARSYVIFGDPAVRMAVGSADAVSTDRPVLESIVLPSITLDSVPSPAILDAPETTKTVAVSEGQVDAEMEDFGLLDRDSLRDARDRLVLAVKDFTDKLGDALERAVDNASSLEVTTYVSDDMSQVPTDFAGSTRLRAYTRINIDGDTTVCVPEDQGDVDQALWAIHLDMVQKAQTNRTEMMKAAVSAATGLLDALKVL